MPSVTFASLHLCATPYTFLLFLHFMQPLFLRGCCSKLKCCQSHSFRPHFMVLRVRSPNVSALKMYLDFIEYSAATYNRCLPKSYSEVIVSMSFFLILMGFR